MVEPTTICSGSGTAAKYGGVKHQIVKKIIIIVFSLATKGAQDTFPPSQEEDPEYCNERSLIGDSDLQVYSRLRAGAGAEAVEKDRSVHFSASVLTPLPSPYIYALDAERNQGTRGVLGWGGIWDGGEGG